MMMLASVSLPTWYWFWGHLTWRSLANDVIDKTWANDSSNYYHLMLYSETGYMKSSGQCFPLVPTQLDSTQLSFGCFPLGMSITYRVWGRYSNVAERPVTPFVCDTNTTAMEDVKAMVYLLAFGQTLIPQCCSLCSLFPCWKISKMAVWIFVKKMLSWLIQWVTE